MNEIIIYSVNFLACAAAGFSLIVLLARFFVRPFRADVLPNLIPPEQGKKRRGKALSPSAVAARIVTAFVASRLLIWVAGLLSAFSAGEALLYARQPLAMWMRWDALHYVGLAENWYVNTGDAMYHLVFFPLYPLLVRGVHLATGWDCAAIGTALSNACLLVSAFAMHAIVFQEQGQEAAERAVLLMLFTPLSFFFSIPYSESLFLMLTLLAVLAARRDKLALAVLLGALASATRLLGLITAVPIYYECVRKVAKKKGGTRMALFYALAMLLVALGFAAYLYLNWRVSGNPLMFLTYQREHWSQRMGSLWNTLNYTLKNACTWENLAMRAGTWIPQAAVVLGVIALLTSLCRTMHPGDGAYALIYFYFAVSPTWLLSGARYLSGMYALYPMLAERFKGRAGFAVAMTLSVAGTCLAVYMYLIQNGIM